MAESVEPFDIAVIGAGIAGASLASALAPSARVVLIECEAQPGYHSTGRSAALFSETYGPPAIRALSRASSQFFKNPPLGFSEHPLLTARGVLMVAREDQADALAALHGELAPRSAVRLLDGAETRRLVPLLHEGYAAGALFEEAAQDIDVHAVHHGYLRRFRAANGTLLTNCEVRGLARNAGHWIIETSKQTLRATIVVNAAGAWADKIAGLAGVEPVGLTPKRRTVLVVAAPEGCDPSPWPMAVDIEEAFYLKPDAGRLLISPADETPVAPCDVQPEELDVAICVDRIETAFDLQVRKIENKWAGLRSFVADKTPVAGYEPNVSDFFWLAGQGGYGIQSAPALARAAAALLRGKNIPADIADQGVEEAALGVARLGRAT